MYTKSQAVTPAPIPSESNVAQFCGTPNLADAYSIPLPSGAATDPELLARFILSHRPTWIHWLLAVRDIIANWLGLRTAKKLKSENLSSEKGLIGDLKIYDKNVKEIIFGGNDKHLDFRISVFFYSPENSEQVGELTFSTVVCCHNRLGRLYIIVIAPFHRLVVRSSLLSAARRGWPTYIKA